MNVPVFDGHNDALSRLWCSMKDAVPEFSRNIGHVKTLESRGAGTAQTFAAEMDPRQLTLVAFVRDAKTKEILQAIQVNPSLPEEPAIEQPE